LIVLLWVLAIKNPNFCNKKNTMIKRVCQYIFISAIGSIAIPTNTFIGEKLDISNIIPVELSIGIG
jgi:hypothetical protein